jgi:hypothetical protein
MFVACASAPMATPGVSTAHSTPPPAASADIGPREEPETPNPKPPPAHRAYMKWGVLSVPSHFEVVDGGYDLIIHFHGGQQLQEENLDRCKINALIVSVNLGIGSGPYSDMFSAPNSLDTALERIQTNLDKLGRAPGAKVRRIALTAWSAGFGGVSAMLNQPGVADRVDAILLADALHANFIGDLRDHKVNPGALENYVAYAKRAVKGEKLLAITHSSIGVDGYATTTETAAELIRLVPLEKRSPSFPWPDGMRAIYEAHSGDMHIIGFEGTRENDHMLHVTKMNATLFPWLKARWRRPR